MKDLVNDGFVPLNIRLDKTSPSFGNDFRTKLVRDLVKCSMSISYFHHAVSYNTVTVHIAFLKFLSHDILS